MPEQSQATKRVFRLAEDLAGFKVVNRRKAEPPFMQERLSKRDLRVRFERWSEEERRNWIGEHGVDAAIDLVRGGREAEGFETSQNTPTIGSPPAEGQGFKPVLGRP